MPFIVKEYHQLIPKVSAQNKKTRDKHYIQPNREQDDVVNQIPNVQKDIWKDKASDNRQTKHHQTDLVARRAHKIRRSESSKVPEQIVS
jgi:hypothetical protein